MNRKAKIIIVLFIIIIVVAVGYLSYYKFVKQKEDNSNKEPEYKFGEKVDVSYEISYAEEYKDNILESKVKEVEYFVTNEDEAIYGKIFIDKTERLYIYDELNNKYKLLFEDVKFKTLKDMEYDGISGLYVYALSNEGNLYFIYLVVPNINKVEIHKYDFEDKIDKFTDLEFTNYLGMPNGYNIVLTKSGKMIDIYSGIEYNSKIVNVFNEYLILEDSTVCGINGNWLIDKSGNKVKVKTLIKVLENDGIFKDSSNVVIITEDNKIVYLDKYGTEVHEYGKTVSKIEYVVDKVIVHFDDGKSISFIGTYDENIYPIK